MSTSTIPLIPHSVREILHQYEAAFEAGKLRIEGGTRHARVRNLASGDFVLLPSSPSGGRWCSNLRRDLARLVVTGNGFIASHHRGAGSSGTHS